MNKSFRTLLFYMLIILVPILLSNYLSSPATVKKDISYSDFLDYLQRDQIESVKVIDQTVTGKLKNGTEFKTVVPEDPNLIRSMSERGIKVEVKLAPQPSLLTTLLTTAVPVLVVVAALFFIMQQTQGAGSKAMQFGRSRARLHTNDKQKVTFADVAGVDEAIEEVREIVEFLKHPKRYLDVGARIPKGVLIFGYPGTGKTLLARAIAGEAGVPFFSISGSDFVEMFVGVGAARVRDLFEQAKKNAPCIVFVDEIDAVGRQRGAGYGGGHDEREQTLNQLLVEMDGFGVNEGIIVVAATNRPDVLDPALLRRGRFDRQIILDRPDVKGRREILAVHTRGKPLDSGADLEIVARRTPGFTGADLENLVNEAALLAARRGKKKIGMAELEEGIDRVIAGPERKSRVMSEKEKRIVAFHESAHALVAKMLPHADPVHKVSVIPRGAALGYVLQLPTEDRHLVTKSEILDKITEMLAGRAAEDLVFGEVTTGAQDDLEKSTRLARKMICEFGMSDELGPLTFGTQQEQVFLGRDIVRERNYSEEIASAIDSEVRHIIDQCYRRAKSILSANRERLDALVEALLEREFLEGKELEELLNSTGTSPVEAGEQGQDLRLEQ